MNNNHVYDMIVVGGGPGGYTAALYAARAGLDTIVLEKLSAGGQMALTEQIDNYPGFENGIDGFSLAEKMQKQAERFGARSEYAEVLRMDLTAVPKLVETSEGIFRGKTVVLATGADPRTLGVAGESELVGRGVAYCAACDGAFFRGRRVAVVGGGNTAVSNVLYLSKLCSEVHLIHRRGTLRASAVGKEALCRLDNLHIHWNCEARELIAGEFLEGVRLENTADGKVETLPLDGIFVAIGRAPETTLFAGMVETDEDGYLLADESTRTSLPGVFAAGDVRKKPVRQIVTAVADGAVAAMAAERYLAER